MAVVLLCLVPARAQAETSTLGVTARVGYGVLETALRNSLNQGKALTSTYQGTAANGHATVRAGYRADLPNLTLSRTGPTELRLAVPVTVTRIERDRTFLNLDKVASLGYQVNGCTTLVVTARAAVTLQPDRGILRLLESPSPPSGQVKSGTCSVTKKPAADIAKLLGGFAGGVVDLFGTVTGNKKLSEQGKALKRQLNALPNRVVVQDLVRDAVDEAVRDAVDRALTSGQDRVLERLFLAKLSEGLERTLSAAGNVVSLGLRPLRTTIDAVAAMPAGLVIEASSELVSSFALAGSVAGGAALATPASDGFALPFEIVLPVRKVADPPAGGEWLVPLSVAGQSIGLTTVPDEDALVRLRLLQSGAAPRTIVYLSASGSLESTVSPVGPKGELDAILNGLVGWLDSGGQLPPEAHGSARKLGGYVEVFRQQVANILLQLSRLDLTDQAVLEVAEPRLRIFPGRYVDGLIRLPVQLIGRASIEFTL